MKIIYRLLLLTMPVFAHANHYPFTLPPLPYAENALEPYIDQLTMHIHHTGHHQKYVDELNKALKDYKNLHKLSLEKLVTSYRDLPDKIQTVIRNNAGGHLNHTFFWNCMTPNKTSLSARLKQALEETFTSIENFKKQFNKHAAQVFGSGWVWLIADSNKNLRIVTTPNQDSPITDGLTPLLGLDVWEHAYYLKHQNKKADYFADWWNVVHWDFVSKNYEEV